ncbi:hypothetical protein AMS68_002445 [Peltaster fructicola]|uniref:Nucleolar protein 12 n=1 Tax=Peltaster fructicola TaxID=286661 RepID=A0A6H0XQL1_9PEZI|nr:hypothetical protein AMS68_002445 [Peltaster fructicola]
MAEKKSKDKAPKGHKDKKENREKKDKKVSKSTTQAEKLGPSVSLLADEKNLDSNLSSLFAAKPAPAKPVVQRAIPEAKASSDDDDAEEPPSHISAGSRNGETIANIEEPVAVLNEETSEKKSRKRKRKDQADDLEDSYMRKLARQDEQEDIKQRQEQVGSKAVLPLASARESDDEENDLEMEVDREADSEEENEDDEQTADGYVPPQHETQAAASNDLEKAGRTVFVGNVSTSAITTKSARKTFEKHLTSFFDQLPKSTDAKAPANKIENMRFRSTPYAPQLPKKAAYARGEVMSTTAQSTNAYVVYSSPALAREACRRLNGTVVLDRHIRVDSVAHPAPVAHKRCVFVGGLSFVDDETNIIAANEAEGREKRKQNQKPSDVEEGLWRLFAKHGTVESVRVIRDKNTRVGIGIAYVQFTDENAVEGALSEDGKKAPPMLPRKLRVTRAKAMKRSKPTADKSKGKPGQSEGYQRKITPGEATLRGRLGKLMGKAAAATAPPGFKGPESFVFEGHRASSKQKNSGLKLGKAAKRKGKPTNRSARRAAAYKAGDNKKKAT